MTSTTLRGVRSYQRLTLSGPLAKAIADRLLLTLIVGIGVGAMNVMMGPMFVALEESIAEMMESIPESVMAIAGGADMATPAGWYTGEMYSIVAPFAVIFVAISSAARAFGGEVENRTIGLVLSTPVRRRRLALDKALAMVVHVSLASLLAALGAWLGIVIADLDLAMVDVLAITLMMILLASAAGGLAMLVSVLTGRGTLAILIAALVAVIAYAWSSFVPMADQVAELAWLSPWHHFIGTDPMGSGVDWLSALLLAAIAVALVTASVYLFRRRDIPA